jgi:hypothetical protein
VAFQIDPDVFDSLDLDGILRQSRRRLGETNRAEGQDERNQQNNFHFHFPFPETYLSISEAAFEEQGNSMFNVELRSRCLNSFR